MKLMVSFFIAGLFTFYGLTASVAQNVKADIPINSENIANWKKGILPSKQESKFLELPWLQTFADGIREADRLEKPLLLWTMNGHPMGCT